MSTQQTIYSEHHLPTPPTANRSSISINEKWQEEASSEEQSRIFLEIEHFFDAITKSTSTGFSNKTRRVHRFYYTWSRLAKIYFKRISTFTSLYSPYLFYSPKVDLFFKASKELSIIEHQFFGPDFLLPNGTTEADIFNLLIERIREESRQPKFIKQTYRFGERSKRQLASLTNYVNALFDHRRSRLIVVRVDLRYKANNGPAMRSNQAKLDLAQLLRDMRSRGRIFSYIEGYVWKLECGTEGAHHFHCIFFFNNDHHQRDDWLGEEIGKYWAEEITHGKGAYFNCNRHDYKAKQTRLGIGRIEAHDEVKRANLCLILKYLTKSSQHIVAKTTKRYRIIGHGESPKVLEVRRGAPRTVNARPNRLDSAVVVSDYDCRQESGGHL